MLRAIFCTAALLAGSLAAHAAGDAAAGKKVFTKCIACHDAASEKDKLGPHLLGVVGRTAGTAESFKAKYSKAMVDAGAAGLVWDEKNLAEYLRAPKDKVPGNKMAFAGVKDDAKRADLIAYLASESK